MKNTALTTFEQIQAVSSLLVREYARGILRLLVLYKDISASETASRLSLHIKTAQDFLEGLAAAGIVNKYAAVEKKRPYFRYSLRKRKICLSFDLDSLYDPDLHSKQKDLRIRERKNSDALFKEGRGNRISSVNLYKGRGRARKEKKLTLSESQGRFLFYLPFPTESFLSITEICKKAGIEPVSLPEILDLIDFLRQHGVIACE